MIAAAAHSGVTPWLLLSAGGVVVGILAAAIRAGRWVGAIEEHLKSQDTHLQSQDDHLQTQDDLLRELIARHAGDDN